jgi:predicted protein tyrosine phosphatase
MMTEKHHALFVCSANLQRSPTAERAFQNWKNVWETKSAGTMPVENGQSLTQELIDWADVIIVMESHHAGYILSNFQTDRTKIKVLDIADVYYCDDPELIRQLEMKVTPILQSFG